MPNLTSTQESLRQSLKADLARIMGVGVDEIPTEASLEVASKFLGIAHVNTFHSWKLEKRYPLVWVLIARRLHIGCESMIDLRLSQMTFPGEAA